MICFDTLRGTFEGGSSDVVHGLLVFRGCRGELIRGSGSDTPDHQEKILLGSGRDNTPRVSEISGGSGGMRAFRNQDINDESEHRC